MNSGLVVVDKRVKATKGGLEDESHYASASSSSSTLKTSNQGRWRLIPDVIICWIINHLLVHELISWKVCSKWFYQNLIDTLAPSILTFRLYVLFFFSFYCVDG